MLNSSFGEFINRKRLEKEITMRAMADELNISAPFLSDVEKGKRNPFDLDRLNQIAEILFLNEEDRALMYELAGKDRKTIAPDLPEYIMGRDYVSAALRTAKDLGAGEAEWLAFVEDLKRRKG